MIFSLIVAADLNNGIGKNGKIPWRIKTDMDFFKKTTVGNGKNAVIMGRTTWESLPDGHRPLKNRLNIILTTNKTYAAASAKIALSFEQALKIAEQNHAEEIFIIGGSKVYAETIEHKNCSGIWLTRVFKTFDCDAFFPKINEKRFKKTWESEIQEENDLKFQFEKWKKLQT
ncbi:dihydrofolate reductase [Candidatus Peregrinibacteria bacterium]|nr:dihydrofolate reductase [Candidatus Peregrinibacteria bacterium]